MDKKIDAKMQRGLSYESAGLRLREEGFNELPTVLGFGFLPLLWKTIAEPMFLLLLIGATLYFLLGSKPEAVLLLSFVVIIISITLRQEYKSEHALLALRKLTSPRAFVIREGKGRRISGREVVREDIVVINEGDRVPADAVLLSSENLSIDESVLTGESFPVRKISADDLTPIATPEVVGGDDLPFVYSGTYVVQGKGIAKVLATGAHTAFGKIGKKISGIKTERTLLQKEADQLVRNFAIFGFTLCMLIAIVYGLTQANWLHGFLAGIVLAMAILPEEIPVVITIFLALGAWRISLQQVLTRRTPAIEALGSATVLCADKTGTITQNRMSLRKLYANGEYYEIEDRGKLIPIPESFHALIEFGILASQRDPFDPMEIAIKSIGDAYLKNTEHIHRNWQLVHQYPLAKELMAISLVWRSQTKKDYIIAAKGAPETIFDLCHLNAKEIAQFFLQVEIIANAGLRVLGIAKAEFKRAELPKKQHDFDFEFLGLIGLADPIRPNVPRAVQSCYEAGIRTIMITGDYMGTAKNVAQQIGLKNCEAVICGPDLMMMDDLELGRRIRTVNVFARILPDQKLRLVNALKANGEIVAMTGDGVNDALALKTAHIGIAMGKRGTDVARESSALVLLDDDFSSIVGAIRLGRRIFDNIKKAIIYIIAVHIPILGLSVLPILLQMPLLLLPAHIVFLELIIDPTCSIVFEAETEEANVMRRPPRDVKEKLFDKKTIQLSASQGLSIFVIASVVFFLTQYFGYDENVTRALTFSVLVMGNIALILANLSWKGQLLEVLKLKKPALWSVIIGALVLLFAVLYIPLLRRLFHFASLSLAQIAICFFIGIGMVFWLRYFHLGFVNLPFLRQF